MPSTQQKAPRRRSAFAAAFLSFIFPGLGHAYAGAYTRALAFAALPFLSLMLLGGVVLRADKLELLGFVIQQPVLYGLLALNLVALIYRIVAVIDAWQVARFLNAVDASGGGRLGRARLPLSPLSLAGLFAILLVMAGGHLAVARYNTLALDLVNCVFSDSGDATCDTPDETPSPGASAEPTASGETPAPTDTPEAVPTPIGSANAGTAAPTLPPWDGKQRLNILLVGSDQRPNESSFNTDTLIVVSIDPQTKQVAMFQVPRDTVDAPVPANAQPVWGRTYSGKINSWFTQNRNMPNLWPGKTQQARGFAALKALLGELYGLDIRYYVMVNFQGFRKVVDTLGGLQVNVQIPVTESTYPVAPGVDTRIYIPAGPQHMTGAEALIYARSRHRAAGGDFDRGRRQQRVLISLREQANPRAILANLPELVNDLKGAVQTDIKVSDMGKLLSLADGVDTKDVRSYVFSPPFFATEVLNDPRRGYIIIPNITRIRAAVQDAFSVDPNVLALRDRMNAEGAQVWVLNASGKTGLASKAADYLGYDGIDASAPNQRPPNLLPTTQVEVYNGAEADMADTIAYLEGLYHVKATMTNDPSVTVDIIVTLGKDAPTLQIDTPG
jgi:LCP family protein required for cell wall assembly